MDPLCLDPCFYDSFMMLLPVATNAKLMLEPQAAKQQ